MSRRAKLILLGILLILLAIPTWHVASNWAPANPLRFRLVSRTPLRDKDGFRYERLDFEVLNTTTARRYLGPTTLQYPNPMGADPFSPHIFEIGTEIPAGGTGRGAVIRRWPKEESPDLGPLEVVCAHFYPFRLRVVGWYWSLTAHLPDSLKPPFSTSPFTQSTVPLEISPEHADTGRAASQAPRGVRILEYFTPDNAP
jgi:hypothetical protein